MWDTYGIFIIIGFGVIAVLLSLQVWADAFYVVTRNWRIAAFITVLGALGLFASVKQEELKYRLAFNYFVGTKNTDSQLARFQVRQCKDFVQAKLDGADTAEFQTISAGFIKIGSISNWEFCARTFGLNYWKHDTSIGGQDGGRLLCDAYDRSSYRSGKVQAWCDTVFAPSPEDDHSANYSVPPPDDVGT